jgi:hypothetical protein
MTECEDMLKVNMKSKVFLPTPLRNMERVEEQLLSLLSSSIDRGVVNDRVELVKDEILPNTAINLEFSKSTTILVNFVNFNFEISVQRIIFVL